jgi:transposase
MDKNSATAMRLTDRQWESVKTQLPYLKPHEKNHEQPWCEDRAILEGILWILRSGAAWAQLPTRYPPSSICYKRFQTWNRSGTLFNVLKALADDLIEHSELKLNAKHIAALFPLTRKKSTVWASTTAAMADDLWAWQTLTVFSSSSTWQALSSTKARWLRRHVREGLCNRMYKKSLLTPSKQSTVLLHPCHDSAVRKTSL